MAMFPPLTPIHPPIREFVFTEADFERVRNLIRRTAGIALNPSKKDMVYGRLVKRVRELGQADFATYLAHLESPSGRSELEAFTNAMTTNLTYFFREEHHFPILAEHYRQRAAAGADVFRVWCAAASTGEEPYSIAMALLDAQAGMARAPRIQILATDLDTQVLLQAREAVYPLAALDKLPTGYASRYFETLPDGKQVRVKPALRQIVSFRRLNLIDPQSGWGISERMDAVFCRNVMIYFDRQTQLDVLAKFPPVLREDGVLFVGHSENFYQANPRLKLRGKTVYEVVTPGQAAPAVSPRRI